MADRPILFSGPMVRALLAGRKTQTRRVLPNPEYYGCPTGDCPHDRQEECNQAMRENTAPDLRFAVGDRLWVKEALEQANGEAVGYPADGSWLPNTNWVWKRNKLSPIFMPRGLSRLTLTVTDVRVERLQDCSEEDAIAEGVVDTGRRDGAPYPHFKLPDFPWIEHDALSVYSYLWDHINGAGSWSANPWVVAVSFDVEHRNINQ
jgi:hypothetical protein